MLRSIVVHQAIIGHISGILRLESFQFVPLITYLLFFSSSGLSFTPKEIGEHLVNVYKRGRPVANSPFSIMVGESEIGDASKVQVYGEGISHAVAGQTAEFMVDTRQAGKRSAHKCRVHGLRIVTCI